MKQWVERDVLRGGEGGNQLAPFRGVCYQELF